MDDRIGRLESVVDQLHVTVQSLQARVAELESHRRDSSSRVAPGEQEAQPVDTASGKIARDGFDPIVVLSLLGRLFLVLAGGFFLRAMTEAGVLATAVGVASAFAYGLAWLVMADRAGRLQQDSSAVCHALAAALVVFPLLIEATSRFHVLSGSSSALVLAALTTGFLLVAWHRHLHAVAWLTVLAALPTSVILILQTGVYAPFTVYLIALGLGTLWLAHSVGWTWLRWPVALLANLAVVGVTMRVFSPGHPAPVAAAVLLQLLLLATYLGSIAVHTLARDRSVTLFDVMQASAVLVIGFGGAIYLTRASGGAPVAIGVIAMALGAACYFVASRLIGRQHEDRNVFFYTSLALVFTLAGAMLDLPGAALAIVLGAFAIMAAAMWSRHGRLFMLLHGAAYVVAATVAAGALVYAGRALTASPTGPWTRPDIAMLAVTAASVLCAWLAAARPDPEGGVAAGTLRLVIAVIVVIVACAAIIGYLAAATASLPDGTVDAGVLATVRTGILAVATLFVAWLGSHARFREWSWLVYPLLVAIGLKMVAQDFSLSRPATLFIALACYGAALIIAPRLKRATRLVSRPAPASGAAGVCGPQGGANASP